MTQTLSPPVESYRHAVRQNGVIIVRTPKGVGVGQDETAFLPQSGAVCVEIHAGGRLLARQEVALPWRDYYGEAVNHLALWVRVLDGTTLLAELLPPGGELVYPFMVLQGEQKHVTESSVAVPPALTITDEVGAIWTLGFHTALQEQSPRGEFAFEVLRDGVGTGVIASRIERRNGQVRVFTRHGWKRWLGREFS